MDACPFHNLENRSQTHIGRRRGKAFAPRDSKARTPRLQGPFQNQGERKQLYVPRWAIKTGFLRFLVVFANKVPCKCFWRRGFGSSLAGETERLT